MKMLVIIIIPFLISSCSNKAVYDNINLNNRNACKNLPASQYDECIKRNSKSYEEYERDMRGIGND